MAKKNRYQKKQNAYFKKKNKFTDINGNAKRIEGTKIRANSYIIFNPKFDVNTVYALLNVHNKINAGMLVRGTERDFADNPNEVYRVVNETKEIEIRTGNGDPITKPEEVTGVIENTINNNDAIGNNDTNNNNDTSNNNCTGNNNGGNSNDTDNE